MQEDAIVDLKKKIKIAEWELMDEKQATDAKYEPRMLTQQD